MTRRSLVVLLDTFAVLLTALILAAINTGGFIVRFADVRLSFRTPARMVIWLAVVLALRAVIGRMTGPFAISAAGWRALLLLPSGSERFDTQAAAGVWRRAVFAAAGLALALVVLLNDQVLHPYSVPDYGDPLFSIWRMGWVVHALVTDPLNLFNGNIFHPLPLTLTLSDTVIVPALAGAPLRAIGIPPVIVYNLLLFAAFWLSGVATYLLVERLTGSARAAFISGLVYATYSYRFDHFSHLELQMTQWMPLGLLALHWFVSTARWPSAFALAMAGVAQLYSGMYYAVFFLVYATVIGVGLLLAQRPSFRRLAVPLAASALIAAVCAVPIVRAFTAAEQIKGERTPEEIQHYSATPSDYIRASTTSAFWGPRLLPWTPERALFPGAAPLVLGAIGLMPPLGAMRLVYAAGLFVAVDGTFGLNGVIYPQLYRWLSPFRGLRSPARFAALVGLTLAIFAGFGALRVLRLCRSRVLGCVVFGLVSAAILFDAWPALKLVPVWKERPPVYAALPAAAGVVLAEFPVRKDAAFNTVYMYFSLWHWKPMINGYSGFIPASYTAMVPNLMEFPLGGSLATLRSRGVTHVTVNCGLGYVGVPECEVMAARVRRMPEFHLLAEGRWEDQRVEIYELTRTVP